jgi:hypothetical protein
VAEVATGEAEAVAVATEAVVVATEAEAAATVEAAVVVAATAVAVEEVCIFKKKIVTVHITILIHCLVLGLNTFADHCTKPPRLKHADSIYARTLCPYFHFGQ